MDWDQAQQNFFAVYAGDMTSAEYTRWNYQEWAQQMSVPGVWAYRGFLWKKYAGKYPTPEEVGLPADHWFFQKDFVDESRTIGNDGVVKSVDYFHHGRKMKPTHRLWPKNAWSPPDL